MQSVDTALRVLSALVEMGPPLMLKTVAERAEMSPPKAHRYLVSFCRGGLAERDPASGGYRLGPLAVRLGLAALRHLHVVNVGAQALGELRDEVGYTAGLAIWGAAGPTFVRFEETNDALIVSGRPGSVMPLLSSSTGRVFRGVHAAQHHRSLPPQGTGRKAASRRQPIQRAADARRTDGRAVRAWCARMASHRCAETSTRACMACPRRCSTMRVPSRA